MNTCSICDEDFNAVTRKPLVLQCGHTFCKMCLENCRKIKNCMCPNCREDWTNVSIDSLVACFQLMGAAASTGSNEEQPINISLCPKHDWAPQDVWCRTCSAKVCLSCLQEHHSQQCDWYPLKTAYKQMQEEVKRKYDACKAQFVTSEDAMDELSAELSEGIKEIDRIVQNLLRCKKNINNCQDEQKEVRKYSAGLYFDACSVEIMENYEELVSPDEEQIKALQKTLDVLDEAMKKNSEIILPTPLNIKVILSEAVVSKKKGSRAQPSTSVATQSVLVDRNNDGQMRYERLNNSENSYRRLEKTFINGHDDKERPNNMKYNREGRGRGERRDRSHSAGRNGSPRYKNRTQTVIRFSPVVLPDKRDPQVLEHLRKCLSNQQPEPQVSVESVIYESRKYWDKFPSDTARLDVLLEDGVPKNLLLDFVKSVYPIVHHSTLRLMLDFLQFKRLHGTKKERDLYTNMDLIAFVDRLLKKRPASFLGVNDQYLTIGLKHGFGGFEAIGTDSEKYPLVLEDMLSFDEMRISSLISLSSWSVFINDGSRKNNGLRGKPETFQRTGVICGQVGTRLRKPGVQEYLDCVVARSDNVPQNGFGLNNRNHVNSVWGNLWGGNLPIHEDALQMCRNTRDGNVSTTTPFEFTQISKDNMLNVTVFKKRTLIIAEILMSEAAERAAKEGKKAYIHVVGLGLGVWKVSDKQESIFVEAWGDALRCFKNTSNIAHIDFSYINCQDVHGVRDGQKFPNTGITIHFSNRQLHGLVPDDCILVSNYAWDGNSLPGNEFWLGKMCTAGSSAAASSSCIAEIHNHLFNPIVRGEVLRVASGDGYLLTWQEYVAGKRATLSATAYDFVPQTKQFVTDANAPKIAPIVNDARPAPVQVRPRKDNAQPTPPRKQQWSTSVQKTVSREQPSTSAVTQAAVGESSPVATEESNVDELKLKLNKTPKQIPHPTIGGCSIDNPEYTILLKLVKKYSKAKKTASPNKEDTKNQQKSKSPNSGKAKSSGNNNQNSGSKKKKSKN